LPALLVEHAPAKVNLTLRVLRRRDDGYHDLESLVAFAWVGDRLSFTPGGEFALTVQGENAVRAGADADNLVLKAARALAARVPGLTQGAFTLDKELPVAAGLGGGSADAAAALRLLARANGLGTGDPRLADAARATGSDVPVCLDPQIRLMGGVGDILSAPFDLPTLPGVLVNPGIAVPTKAVFAAWRPGTGQPHATPAAALAKLSSSDKLLGFLTAQANDLEAPAIMLAPSIADVLAALRRLPGCTLARMSGSGATCFGIFASAEAALRAGEELRAEHPRWWVEATALGVGNRHPGDGAVS
jgi:4-diphosphocytidyl-2-C-methyl-D-erythritol kinase